MGDFQLAKSQGMSAQSLFTELAKRGLIEKEGKSWALTTNGKQAGGEYKKTTQYGTYIVWLHILAQPDHRFWIKVITHSGLR